VAHYRVKDDEAAIAKIREFVSELPKKESGVRSHESGKSKPKKPEETIYEIFLKIIASPTHARAS